MNYLPEIAEPLLLDGRAHTREGLLDYCREQLEDPNLAPWRSEILSFISLFLDPEGASIIQKSSGSTGDPKTFSLSRESMIVSANRTLRFFNLNKGDRALLALPVHYIAGKMMVVRALVGGLDLHLAEPSSRPLQNLHTAIAFTAMVPLQVEETLNYSDPLDLVSILLIGGGDLHPASREKLSRMPVPEVYESFGMTETYTHFALRRVNGPDPDSCFRLLEGVRAGIDQRGCLEVEVSGITSGTLLTNDLVEITGKRDGFTWLGRFDNIINTGGVKIIPEILEEQIGKILGKDCLVLPEADRKLGNRLVLVVEFQGDPPLKEWMERLRPRLSNYELPRRIIAVQALPRNASMKPDRTSALNLLL